MSKYILIIDDEEGIRLTLAFTLEDEGYTVDTASTGVEALEMMKKRRYDMVITDLMMPGISGMEIVKHTKKRYPDTVVIMITGRGSEEKAVEAMKLGADDYIPKPIEPEEMLIKLSKTMEMQRLKQENRSFQKHLEQELDTARKIQQSLLPQSIPAFNGIDISIFSQPAKHVGGDYHDLIQLPSGKLGVAIGDVSGKGMPAALLMANVQASIRRCSEELHSPGEVISRINRSLCPICQYIEEHRFITLFYGIFDPQSNDFIYSNAGHNYPLVFRQNLDDFYALESTGLPCGILDDAEYDENSLRLSRDDVLLLYTDGITEATNPDGIMFGEENLVSTITGKYDLCSKNILENINNELESFTKGKLQNDDLTLMVLKFSI
ncbi:SpoIIE family protein phosphatase [Candidatus Poribacteria bacterium]|nr:SpoIIE family protein phosphatase [Candidatus Poribacteria bacterium]